VAQPEWCRRGHRPPEANLLILVLHINLTVRKLTEGTVGLKTTSVSDDMIDWPLPNRILGCATASGRVLPVCALRAVVWPCLDEAHTENHNAPQKRTEQYLSNVGDVEKTQAQVDWVASAPDSNHRDSEQDDRCKHVEHECATQSHDQCSVKRAPFALVFQRRFVGIACCAVSHRQARDGHVVFGSLDHRREEYARLVLPRRVHDVGLFI